MENTNEVIKVATTIIACVVVLKCIWKILSDFWLTPKRLEKCLRQQGLVGNSYKFLVGDMKESSKLRSQALLKPIPLTHDYFCRIQPLLHHLLKNSDSSTNCYTWMGPVPTILITQHEQIREVFNRMNQFRKPKLNELVETLFSGLVSYEGEKWAKHRKVVNPAFHMEKLKHMLQAFETSIGEAIDEWEKKVPKIGSSEVDVWPCLMSMTADGISRAAFGSSYKDGRKIFDLITEQKEIVMSNIKYSFIPGWKYFPTKAKKRLDEIDEEVQVLLNKVIGRRKKAMEAGEPPKEDVLGILLESSFREAIQIEGVGGRRQYALSFPEIVAECKLFYNAGQETTAVLLAWTMVLLGKHQDWQSRAREEVLATFGMNTPDFDGLNSRLKIVTMILNEVLRLYPSVGATSRRVYEKEAKLGDLVIPAGAVVSVSIIHAHLDHKVWGNDAKEFNPERFSQGIAKATKGTNAYLPFGWGPRICIGQNFALLEAKMALSMILQRFTFELSPSYIHAPTSLTALQPQHGVQLILHRF